MLVCTVSIDVNCMLFLFSARLLCSVVDVSNSTAVEEWVEGASIRSF